MKILEKQTKILYRFRCNRCRSKFEMTKNEKEINDWKYGDHKAKSLFPHNPLDKFYCPVCKKVEYVRKEDMHKVIVMNNGNEIEY